jgi:hypothetical protein
MKKLLFMLLLSPLLNYAQNTTIDLSTYGLKATLNNPDNYEYTVKKSDEDGIIEYNIYLDDDKITVNDYPKPMTAKKVMDIYFSMPKTKSKSSTFKILEKGANKVVIEANYSGSLRYMFFYSFVAKGKQIVVAGTSIKDLETCKKLQKIGESFKLN